MAELLASEKHQIALLIDALDEVEEYDDLINLINFIQALVQAGQNKNLFLIVSSRPSTTKNFSSPTEMFDEYQISCLDRDAVGIVARKWLPATADVFLREAAGLINSGLLTLPLTLTIALWLVEQGGELSGKSAADLYGDLAAECGAKWNRDQRVVARWGQETLSETVNIMAFVSLDNLMSRRVLNRGTLVELVTRFFLDCRQASTPQAKLAAARFADFAKEDAMFFFGNPRNL